jgi:hypothetical protein
MYRRKEEGGSQGEGQHPVDQGEEGEERGVETHTA